MFGIPINPTILFLYPFVSSPSLFLSSACISCHGLSPLTFIPPLRQPGTSSSKSGTTIFHSGRGGARGGGPPFSRLSCARPLVTPCLRVLILIAYLTIRADPISRIREGRRWCDISLRYDFLQ